MLEEQHNKLCGKAKEPTTEDEAASPVFYRCVCPECGEDTLSLLDLDMFAESPILGATSTGEIGCSHTSLDSHGCNLEIWCRSCGGPVGNPHSLIEWAKAQGEVRTTLPFQCPKCGSRELHRVEIGLEFVSTVVAVSVSDTPGVDPIVALSHERDLDKGEVYRYRCSSGHVLAAADGFPVQTDEELVVWLKTRQSAAKE